MDWDDDGDFSFDEANDLIGPMGWIFAPVGVILFILFLTLVL